MASAFPRIFGLLLLAALAGCASAGGVLPPPPVHGIGLWRIIDRQCVPDQVQHGDPKPCAEVVLTGGREHGYVVLKDKEGVAQHLLMPADRVTGIEDPKILQPGRPNYFAAAWDARRFVDARLARTLPLDAIGVAINSAYGRSQDQLHIHVDCLSTDVQAALKADAPQIDDAWSRRTFILNGHPYRIRRIASVAVDPFQLLARTMPGAAEAMGAWTLVETGAPDGRGFYLIATRADPAHNERAAGESLQDHDCAGR